jgi:hypothetical protein
MPEETMEYYAVFEIKFEHELPFRAAALSEVIRAIEDSAKRVAVEQVLALAEELEKRGLEPQRAISRIRRLRGDIVWIESVSPGSSKFTLRVKKVALFVLEGMAFDMLVGDAETYKDFKRWVRTEIAETAAHVGEDLKRVAGHLSDGTPIEVTVDPKADRVRVIVYPKPQFEFEPTPPPDKPKPDRPPKELK